MSVSAKRLVLLVAGAAMALADHCVLTPPDTDDDMLGPFFIKDVPYKGCASMLAFGAH